MKQQLPASALRPTQRSCNKLPAPRRTPNGPRLQDTLAGQGFKKEHLPSRATRKPSKSACDKKHFKSERCLPTSQQDQLFAARDSSLLASASSRCWRRGLLPTPFPFFFGLFLGQTLDLLMGIRRLPGCVLERFLALFGFLGHLMSQKS